MYLRKQTAYNAKPHDAKSWGFFLSQKKFENFQNLGTFCPSHPGGVIRGVRTHLTVWLHAGQLNSLPTGICVGVRLCHDSRLDACAAGKGARALLQGSVSEAGGLCTRTRSSPQNARHLCRGGRRNAIG